MTDLHYPWKTIAGLGVTALLALYGTIEFYGEQTDRNKVRNDPYQIVHQVERFAPLNQEVPPGTALGYVSDLPYGPQALTAQYAVAPRILVGDVPHEYVLGDFYKPLDYAEFGRQRGLTIVKQFPSGVVLFRKAQP